MFTEPAKVLRTLSSSYAAGALILGSALVPISSSAQGTGLSHLDCWFDEAERAVKCPPITALQTGRASRVDNAFNAVGGPAPALNPAARKSGGSREPSTTGPGTPPDCRMRVVIQRLRVVPSTKRTIPRPRPIADTTAWYESAARVRCSTGAPLIDEECGRSSGRILRSETVHTPERPASESRTGCLCRGMLTPAEVSTRVTIHLLRVAIVCG